MKNTTKLLLAFAMSIPVLTSQGAWVFLNDFEAGDDSLTAWSYNSSWYTDGGSGMAHVIETVPGPVDPDNNNVLFTDPLGYGVGWQVYRFAMELPEGATIPQGGMGTLYFRIYSEGDLVSLYCIGNADSPSNPLNYLLSTAPINFYKDL